MSINGYFPFVNIINIALTFYLLLYSQPLLYSDLFRNHFTKINKKNDLFKKYEQNMMHFKTESGNSEIFPKLSVRLK